MTADTLSGLLIDAGIRLPKIRAASTEKTVCPKCHGGRTREKSLSVTIDADGQGATWQCWRGKCGWKSGGRIGNPEGRVVPLHAPKPASRPMPHRPEEQSRPAWLYGFFAERGIGADTVDAFGVYAAQYRFDGANAQPAIVFPYTHRGQLVNRKFRSQTKDMRQDANPQPTLYNVDAISAPDVVVWVEGEPDVMAMHEAGYPQTVSLKDGAPAELREEDDPARGADKRFAALATHGDMLLAVERFILAGDADEPGMVLREELARRLGRHRCWLVTWPDGCKDACDTLRRYGPAGVQTAIEAASPYPIEGVHQIDGKGLDDYLNTPAPRVMSTGVGATDQILKLPGEGRLIVVTGVPNSGKSCWTMFAMVHLMKHEGRKFLVFSPEMQPWNEFATQMAQILIAKPARRTKENSYHEVMTKEERIIAGDWLKDRCAFLSCDSEEESPNLQWILDKAHDSVLRYGITDLLIDPWNEIEHQRDKNASETEYTGRCLQQIKAFSTRHGCNVWVIAHPTKIYPAKHGEKIHAPTGYDISGSANWFNKADIGITIHTPEAVTEFHLWKSRFSRWGRKGAKVFLDYNKVNGRYSTPVVEYE